MKHVQQVGLGLLSILLLLSGCASEPEVVQPKGPRVATSADQVKIYEKEPQKYEPLGVVSVTADNVTRWEKTGDATAGFEKLRSKAAALGANGLLLKVEKGMNDAFVLAGHNGTFYEVPISGTPPTAYAQAIYVLKE